jgi:amino acid transporter
MFAMSFDRMLPSALASVKTRFATPLYALVTCFIGSMIMGYLYYYTVFARYTLDMPLAVVSLFLAVCFAGIVFPYIKRTRAMYEASPVAKYKIGGAPLITVAGVLGFLYSLYMWILYALDSRYGVNEFWSALFMIGGFVVSAIIYIALKLYRRAKGVEVDKLYGTIPVE